MEQLGPYQQERSVIIFIKPKRDGKREKVGRDEPEKKVNMLVGIGR
jgi:hypothetical protein